MINYLTISLYNYILHFHIKKSHSMLLIKILTVKHVLCRCCCCCCCWRWWIVFVVWLTYERRLALFPVGTIVRDPHHLKSPIRRHAAGFQPVQNLSSGVSEWICAVAITITPRHHSGFSMVKWLKHLFFKKLLPCFFSSKSSQNHVSIKKLLLTSPCTRVT